MSIDSPVRSCRISIGRLSIQKLAVSKRRFSLSYRIVSLWPPKTLFNSTLLLGWCGSRKETNLSTLSLSLSRLTDIGSWKFPSRKLNEPEIVAPRLILLTNKLVSSNIRFASGVSHWSSCYSDSWLLHYSVLSRNRSERKPTTVSSLRKEKSLKTKRNEIERGRIK